MVGLQEVCLCFCCGGGGGGGGAVPWSVLSLDFLRVRCCVLWSGVVWCVFLSCGFWGCGCCCPLCVLCVLVFDDLVCCLRRDLDTDAFVVFFIQDHRWVVLLCGKFHRVQLADLLGSLELRPGEDASSEGYTLTADDTMRTGMGVLCMQQGVSEHALSTRTTSQQPRQKGKGQESTCVRSYVFPPRDR